MEDPPEVEGQEEVLQPESVLRHEDKVLRSVGACEERKDLHATDLERSYEWRDVYERGGTQADDGGGGRHIHQALRRGLRPHYVGADNQCPTEGRSDGGPLLPGGVPYIAPNVTLDYTTTTAVIAYEGASKAGRPAMPKLSTIFDGGLIQQNVHPGIEEVPDGGAAARRPAPLLYCALLSEAQRVRDQLPGQSDGQLQLHGQTASEHCGEGRDEAELLALQLDGAVGAVEHERGGTGESSHPPARHQPLRGVWFMHCHLEFHTSAGLDTAFVIEDGPNLQLDRIIAPPIDLPPC
ncbi:hypothetical protein L7F22_013981 [Adiantum nelumboides]|nr:hypothetical protein [Adiantum nelumboides]